MRKQTERLTWLALATFVSTLLLVSFCVEVSDAGDHALFDPHLQGPAIAALIIMAILSIISILQWRKSSRRSK
jgi:hypothetical protein